MTLPIQPGSSGLSGLSLPKPLQEASDSIRSSSVPQATDSTSNEFQNLLLNGLDQVEQMQSQADQTVQKLLIGDDVNTAEVLTAVQKADLAFQLMMQIRNKMVDAFQEIKELRI